ncbi:MAG: peptidylprolyl isomerase [Muribaculaceae bacterium]|nr:peptidylprolyl isomerase [Muribaculaceae bacterium]MDE6331817.1 peptidylprolyl isomerase [Muribaculaceae bacterium]
MTSIRTAIITAVAFISMAATAQNNIIDEVAWVIGDDPIYKSEIEEFYQEALQERIPIKGDPYCTLPEQMAIERLFLHQADLDTVLVSESMVQQQVEGQMNFLLNNLGSKEKIEQYFRKPFSEIRDYYATNMRNRYRVGQVKQALTKDVKVTPNDVRRYVDRLPADSLPYVPLQVEVQIMTLNPVIPREEIESVKARLRDMAERVNRGENDFSTMAILYSEDDGSSVRGGEIGFKGRAELVPEYAAVAFNLNDPKKVSKIVETEYGYHIIQLIEKRGERVNTRHILLRPKVADKDLTDAVHRLDSVRTDIVDNHKFTFEEATRYISQDKDTRYSNGVMVNEATGTTMFEMSHLPQEVARTVASLKPGEISEPFIMKDPKLNRDIVAIVKLTNRLDAHTANLADDFQLLKNMYENSAKEEILDKWLEKKIRETYIRIEDGWRGCEFEHDGWLKNNK